MGGIAWNHPTIFGAMNPSPSPIAAIDASAVTPPSDFGRERRVPRRRAAARRFLPRVDVRLTGIMILFGATALSTLLLGTIALALAGAIEAGRWVLGAGAHPPAHVASLVGFSALGGLVLGCAAGAAFLLDLRRQRWL